MLLNLHKVLIAPAELLDLHRLIGKGADYPISQQRVLDLGVQLADLVSLKPESRLYF